VSLPADDLDSIRVLTRAETLKAVGVSSMTWWRMEQDKETPPKTRLSEGRFGYRLIDVREWLNKRREEA
jgi:predicted DNA-binding transcriptional regulator AlpA